MGVSRLAGQAVRNEVSTATYHAVRAFDSLMEILQAYVARNFE